MDLGKRGGVLFWFTDALTPAQLIELAQRTEQLGYSGLWYPEALGYGQRIQAHCGAGAGHVCIQPLHPNGEPLPDFNALTVLAH
jgi:alkanesulfonate monooxygenase SsuD/methylene tetrahydromethanopterin reductase-like flavin-dependent oxidoreductase (luciferase family)